MKLIQKDLLKGTQTFELTDEVVKLKIKSLLKKKELEVPLAILNPEPVTNGSRLEFFGRVKCGPLLSFYIDKPNAKEFKDFIDALKNKALKEFNSFAGID